jgi:hypothetical protein
MMFVMKDLKFDTDTSVFISDILTFATIGDGLVRLYKSKTGIFFIVFEKVCTNITESFEIEKKLSEEYEVQFQRIFTNAMDDKSYLAAVIPEKDAKRLCIPIIPVEQYVSVFNIKYA